MGKFTSYSSYVFGLSNPLRLVGIDGATPFDITESNSGVTVKTDWVDLKVNASGLGAALPYAGDWARTGKIAKELIKFRMRLMQRMVKVKV